MQCPKCSCSDHKVVDSRVSKEGKAIRRRRECNNCNNRFTTYETIIPDELLVVKRDGSREDFSPEKIRRGIRHACWKRQVAEEQIEKMVAEVVAMLSKPGDREIPSQKIGELVMSELQKTDEVAYIRFASVYRQFKDVDTFMAMLKGLAHQK